MQFDFIQIGMGGVGVALESPKQKVLSSTPIAAYPQRGALRTQLGYVYANSFGLLKI
jgi:hypothetical protein